MAYGMRRYDPASRNDAVLFAVGIESFLKLGALLIAGVLAIVQLLSLDRQVAAAGISKLASKFAPDGVYAPATNQLESANVFAEIGAVRVPMAPGVRVNLMGSYQNVDYADVLTLANVGTFNQHAWSTAANLFYSPVKNIDLGVEYRHGERELVNGADGSTDRIEVVAKNSF